MARLTNSPSLIEISGIRFLIHDAPSNSNIALYIKEFQKHNVKDVVRVCSDTYSKEIVERANIKVHDWPFDDGSSPPAEIIQKWLDLVDQVFPENSDKPNDSCIAVHCVAGLGRAPVLVAIALMERTGMSALDAISFIRRQRRGAINAKQMQFLEKYKVKRKRNRPQCAIC